MMKVAAIRQYATLADVQDRVGDVPGWRIKMRPTPGAATVLDLLDESVTSGHGVELVGGILVEKPMGVHEDYLAAWLVHLLQSFVVPHQLGAVLGSQSPVRFNLDLVRLPVVSFIRWDSLDDPDTIEVRNGAFLEAVPDLVIEVLCPSNTPKEMAIKLDEYATAGVRLVWYVDPDRQEVTVYPKGKERGKKVFGVGDVLDGGNVLPGFTLLVAKIFEKRAPAKKPKRKGK